MRFALARLGLFALFALLARLRGMLGDISLPGVGVAVVASLVAVVALAAIERLALARLVLRRGDDAEVMFGVLVVVLGGDRITGALRVAGELNVFFGDLGGGSADFDVGSGRFENARQRILAAAVAIAQPLVLTVSHDLTFCHPA